MLPMYIVLAACSSHLNELNHSEFLVLSSSCASEDTTSVCVCLCPLSGAKTVLNVLYFKRKNLINQLLGNETREVKNEKRY